VLPVAGLVIFHSRHSSGHHLTSFVAHTALAAVIWRVVRMLGPVLLIVLGLVAAFVVYRVSRRPAKQDQ
jgi:hypothetical protein